jgi:hypothetical protein
VTLCPVPFPRVARRRERPAVLLLPLMSTAPARPCAPASLALGERAGPFFLSRAPHPLRECAAHSRCVCLMPRPYVAVDAVICLPKIHKACIEVGDAGPTRAVAIRWRRRKTSSEARRLWRKPACLTLGAQNLPFGKRVKAGMQDHAEKLDEGALALGGAVRSCTGERLSLCP